MLTTPRTIYAKGLILISVPLLLQLAFGVTMLSLQRSYEHKIEKERTAQEIIFHANEMFVNCAEVMMLKSYSSFFGGPEPPIQARAAQLNHEYSLLKELVADDSWQTQKLEQIRSITNRVLDLCNQFRSPLSTDRSASAKTAVLMSQLDTFKTAYALVNPISSAILHFRQPFLHTYAAAKQVDSATALVDWVVFGSLAGSTLVSVLLFVYFIRSINRGLEVMVDNTRKFRGGEELEPRLGGADELAQVDAAFHEMADEIREAQRTKQAVVSMISHDLRTPLASVLGYFSLLTSGAFGEPSQEAMSAVEKSERDIEKLIRLISDLLELDRMEANKLTLRPRPVSVKRVINRAIDVVEPFADQHAVTIRGAESSAEICADPDRIVQALANLLSSAVTLSPRGSYVDANVVQHENEVEFRVTSSAASMANDLLKTQFDRYQQRKAGLGLELPISKEIIKLHGGMIGATSEQPQGCTFWFRLAPAQASNGAVTN